MDLPEREKKTFLRIRSCMFQSLTLCLQQLEVYSWTQTKLK